MRRITTFAAGLLVGLAAAVTAIAADKVVGSAAPDCALTALNEGPAYDLRQFRGKVLYVDFWASWCTTCIVSFPFLNTLQHEYGDRGLAILGINVDQKPQDALKFLGRTPAHFMIAADHGGTCPRSFDVQAMPSSYLVDRQGVVRYRHLGFRSGQADEIRTQIAALLAEPERGQ